MNFSERLRELRAEKDVTQIELAKKTGLSNGCIAMLEINKREPTGNTLIALSNFFECSIDYLLGREDDLGVIQVYPQTDKLDTLNADEQKIIDFIRKNPPLNATEWIELYAELPRYMQESIFAELRGMHLGFKAAKTKNAAKK